MDAVDYRIDKLVDRSSMPWQMGSPGLSNLSIGPLAFFLSPPFASREKGTVTPCTATKEAGTVGGKH